MKNKKHHLIFEGAELVGKSFLMSQIYDVLEKRDNSHKKILNGCHWFNCDVGIFGTPQGQNVINKYIDILEILKDKNVLLEKLHLTDHVYHLLYDNKKTDYISQEKRLKELNAKIILITVKDQSVFAERLPDRINNTPHYKRVAQTPADYWRQQETYLKLIKHSQLDHIIIDFSKPLDKKFVRNQVDKILKWIGEK